MSKKIALFLLSFLSFFGQVVAEEYSWKSDPNNPRNRPNLYNFRFKPQFWQNLPESPYRQNLVNALGIVYGYAVFNSKGGIVSAYCFDNDGKFLGYSSELNRGDVNKTENWRDDKGNQTTFTVKSNVLAAK